MRLLLLTGIAAVVLSFFAVNQVQGQTTTPTATPTPSTMSVPDAPATGRG